MRFRLSIVLSGTVLALSVQALPAAAQDEIRAFVNSSGKVVFTNLVEERSLPAPATPLPEKTEPLALETPDWLRMLVDSISGTHGVDAALVRAVIKTESNFNRWAVSSKGALGLMQLIPSTGRRYGVHDFFDPQQNIDGGVRHLKFLLEKFNGNLDLSLAAYNAGENLVERLGRIPSIPETMDYVQKIRAIYKKPTPAEREPGWAKPQEIAAPTASPAVVAAAPEPPKIFKAVDARGVVHFSNIEPLN